MSRTATIRTPVDEPERVAASVTPDNTTEMETSVDAGTIVTTIERETTAGLRATVDDYVVNLTVAVEIAQLATEHRPTNT